MKIRTYLSNCFLLLLPVFLWNILLTTYLPKSYGPEIFWKNIPPIIGVSENILRILTFSIPVLMIFSLKTKLQKKGFVLYLIGLVLYFLAWTVMILYPESNWGQSLIGFMAPAFTTIIWYIGIGLIGNKAFLKIPYISLIYICLAIFFVLFHSIHAYIVFQRL